MEFFEKCVGLTMWCTKWWEILRKLWNIQRLARTDIKQLTGFKTLIYFQKIFYLINIILKYLHLS